MRNKRAHSRRSRPHSAHMLRQTVKCRHGSTCINVALKITTHTHILPPTMVVCANRKYLYHIQCSCTQRQG